MKDVDGKLVLITGAARGMGKMTAMKFAEHGARVILTDIDDKGLKAAVKDVNGAGGGKAFGYQLDVTKHDQINQLAEKISAEHEAPDILINNAGIVFGGDFLGLSDAQLQVQIGVNLMGVLWMTRAFLPGMIKKGAGHVINMSSASGLIGVPFVSVYSATKWAVLGFTQSMQLEIEAMGHNDIIFTAVCPSYVSTGMFDGVEPPLLTDFITPEKMASKIYEAVIREKELVLEPFMVKITPLLKAILPIRLRNRLAHRLGVTTGPQSWKGHSG